MTEPKNEIEAGALAKMQAATQEMREFARLMVWIQDEWRRSGAPTPSPVMRLCSFPLPPPAGIVTEAQEGVHVANPGAVMRVEVVEAL